MRRAAWEMRRVLPQQVTIVEDAVPTHPSFTLLAEYSKYLATRLRAWRPGDERRGQKGADARRSGAFGAVWRDVLFGHGADGAGDPLPAAAARSRAVVALCNGWSHMQRWGGTYSGREVRVEGTVPQGAVLVAMKHESMFEAVDFPRSCAFRRCSPRWSC
jgi:hypothetical protein